MQEKPVTPLTEKEYLAWERASEVKHDFYQGEIFAMAGASERHNLILKRCANISSNRITIGNQGYYWLYSASRAVLSSAL